MASTLIRGLTSSNVMHNGLQRHALFEKQGAHTDEECDRRSKTRSWTAGITSTDGVEISAFRARSSLATEEELKSLGMILILICGV